MIEIISRPKVRKWKVKCLCGAELKYAEGDENETVLKEEIQYYIRCPLCHSECTTRRYLSNMREMFTIDGIERVFPLIADYRSEEFYE